MAGDNDELYNDELYGDLDDLDEELVDPDDDPSQSSPAAPAPAVAASATAAPPQQPLGGPSAAGSANAGQPYSFQGDAGSSGQAAAGPGSFAGAGADQGDLDRIRPSDMPDEGKMFIGGLNWETTDDGLKMYMAQYGEIDSCVVMRDPSGRSRGFAFLTYKHPSSVTKVLEKTHHLDGKQIDPKRAIPRAEHERTAKVFVGGLAPSVTSEGLKEFLTQFGQVMDATVMYDKETTRSKGFAFATFSDEEAVSRAMAMSGIELQGKAIEIKRAQPRGSGNLPKQWNNTRPQGFGGAAQGGAGGGGAFDGNAMAAMYQNMKGPGMGGMNMGFDPAAMTMMYQNMLKTMSGMNAPAINPNMARNGMGGMGGMGMGNMGGMGMGMFPMMGMMGGGGMGGMNGMGGGGMGFNNQAGGMGMGGMQGMGGGGAGAGPSARNVPNAPRGPAAMRGAGGPGAGGPGAGQGGAGAGAGAGGQARQGPGADRYSTQGNARARPY